MRVYVITNRILMNDNDMKLKLHMQAKLNAKHTDAQIFTMALIKNSSVKANKIELIMKDRF